MPITTPRRIDPTVTAVADAGEAGWPAGQSADGRDAASPVRFMAVDGARLPYVEAGTGTPVVLVHGAMSDHRTWNVQREVLSARYRAIAYTQRYFGANAWDMNGPTFGVQTHSDDLAAFVRGLNAGPVHLVGWSYGGHVVLDTVVNHPDLVRSAFVFEPPFPTFITDPAVLRIIGEDMAASGVPDAAKAAVAGDHELAVRTMIDAVSQRPGYFADQAGEVQAMQRDSAHTLKAQLVDLPSPPVITCAQLGQMEVPVAIARGEWSRPMLREVAEAAARCITGKPPLVVPKQTHMWPREDPQGFADAVMSFLKDK